jgi:hypothetical protein
MDRIGPFIKASGFDEVTVEDGMIHIANLVGIMTIELTLELVDDPGATLAYEQREGIFEEMRTTYRLTRVDEGTEVTATTTFELGVPLVGDALDSTVIERQRRSELAAQFDWLAGNR